VESLLLYVPLFPKGTMVKLSDGRDGIIVDNSGTRNLRPLLRLLDGTMIDLQKKEYLNITILHETNEDVMDPQWAEEERKEMLASIKNFSIMIIDDMLISIQSISGFLEKTYELTCVTNYEEAVKSLRRNGKQDLLIIDMDMPRMNGIQVCAKLKELLGADMPPVLFIIEESTRELVSKCRRAGAAGYIVRPFKPTYVKAEIKRVLTGTNVAE
jgi:CheY-like chemotaxis protein